MEHYRLLDAVRSDGDWEAWLEFFLTGVTETAGGAVETMHLFLALFREDELRVNQGAASLVRLYQALRSHPVANIAELARRTGTSFHTASTGIETLVELGIAREITGNQRNRVFAYVRYMAILNEGAEPLCETQNSMDPRT